MVFTDTHIIVMALIGIFSFVLGAIIANDINDLKDKDEKNNN